MFLSLFLQKSGKNIAKNTYLLLYATDFIRR